MSRTISPSAGRRYGLALVCRVCEVSRSSVYSVGRERSHHRRSLVSVVRRPKGNGVSERFIRTLNEQLFWIRHFATVEELRLALLELKEKYNRQWLVEKHDYRTPAQVRADFSAEKVG
jgi:transposase InsO family protein